MLLVYLGEGCVVGERWGSGKCWMVVLLCFPCAEMGSGELSGCWDRACVVGLGVGRGVRLVRLMLLVVEV